jgi:RNA polymerase sigma-70 factor (ECF subfamily)
MSEAELIEACLRGERDAFRTLIDRAQRMVEAVAFSATGDGALIDDVVQDTFVTAWQQLDRLRDPTRCTSWLCGIARNLAHKARRRRKREMPLVEPASETTPFDSAADRERDARVNAALARLATRYREPLILFYYQHCSVKEVADALAIREEAAMQRLTRGRKQLGAELADSVEDRLEKRRSRKGLAALVLPLLVGSRARDATAAVSVRHVVAAITSRWRIFAAVATVAAVSLGMMKAISMSEQVAAAQAARAAQSSKPHGPAKDPSEEQPKLRGPEPEQDNSFGRTNVVASPDPVESCTRAARALMSGRLRLDAWQLDAIAEKVGATCAGEGYPELYRVCEGTPADMRDGNITCYPYDGLSGLESGWPSSDLARVELAVEHMRGRAVHHHVREAR